MDPYLAGFLDDLKDGNISAVLVLADALEDAGDHRAERVRMYAESIQTSDSFFDSLMAVAAVIGIMEGNG